ncbi:MAG TPA: class I SAM-dependent methyltransferase [Candidatus Paceibacterota bacterium]|nr:class I SAM-dependent methyltransferase [Candidatus Paceibacterota bacterium]
MKNINEFLSKRQTASGFNIRLRYFINQYLEYKKTHFLPIKILDIGCGQNCELFKYRRKEDKYCGCDFYDKINIEIDDYQKINLNEENLADKYKDEKFDVIFCGEVIEHLFSPDNLLDEIKELMHKNSILILSTPNLGYYMNRIMLLFGISPFFLENSSEIKLGRKCRFLGQFNKTEGHIRLFTYSALRELLNLKEFQIIKIKSVPVWDNVFDRIIGLLSKSLSADNVFLLQLGYGKIGKIKKI